jgi:hypothetical protein
MDIFVAEYILPFNTIENTGCRAIVLMESLDKVWSEKVYEVYVCISACFVFRNSRGLTILGFVLGEFKFSNYAAKS